MTQGQFISEATEATFHEEVIERSRSVAVIVDFWASWCAPCKMLTPILESAVASRGGQAWLVKVNVEDSPSLAAEYGVQGVPAVKAFVDGRIVDEFVGAQNRAGVEAFFDRVCPSQEDRALQKATALLDSGRAEGVPDILAPALNSPPHRDLALILVARHHALLGKYDDAEAALDLIPESSPEGELATSMKLKLDMMRSANGDDEAALRQRIEGDERDAEARWALAGLLLKRGQVEASLNELLEILISRRDFNDDGARRAMLAIFDEIGIHHELSHKFRKRMQIYL
jgi:putative thioredoxin